MTTRDRCMPTVGGQRFSGIGPNGLSYYYYLLLLPLHLILLLHLIRLLHLIQLLLLLVPLPLLLQFNYYLCQSNFSSEHTERIHSSWLKKTFTENVCVIYIIIMIKWLQTKIVWLSTHQVQFTFSPMFF